MKDYVRIIQNSPRTLNARGSKHRGLQGIKVYLEEKVFKELKARAIRNELTISAQVRLDILEGHRQERTRGHRPS